MLALLAAAVLVPAAGGLPPSRLAHPPLWWDALALALDPLAACG